MRCWLSIFVTFFTTSFVWCTPIGISSRQAPDGIPEYVLQYGMIVLSLSTLLETIEQLTPSSTSRLSPLRRGVLPHRSPVLPRQRHSTDQFHHRTRTYPTHSIQPQPTGEQRVSHVQRRRNPRPSMDKRHQARQQRQNRQRRNRRCNRKRQRKRQRRRLLHVLLRLQLRRRALRLGRPEFRYFIFLPPPRNYLPSLTTHSQATTSATGNTPWYDSNPASPAQYGSRSTPTDKPLHTGP
jgi:hypothetical protein